MRRGCGLKASSSTPTPSTKPPYSACASRNHPLPDDNKRVAYLALLEFLARNNINWEPPSVDETVATIGGVAAGQITEHELAEWLRARLG
jgi:death-on-curing protein